MGALIKNKDSKDKAILEDKMACPMCKEEKRLSTEFPKSKPHYGGYDFTRCKSCKGILAAQKRNEIPAEVKRMRYSCKKYDITEKEFNELNSRDNCDLCGVDFSTKKAKYTPKNIDHDHSTGEIRGVLCNGCNLGLRKLGDNFEGIEKALNYLKKINND